MHKPNQSRKGKGTRFPNVTSAAAEMGVSRPHLYRVLMGQLPDHHNYRERYRVIKRKLAERAA
jgi:hypothetical protein